MSSANVYFVEFEQVYIYFDVFCLNFSIEMKIKTIFLISYFNLSKKNEMALWVHGLLRMNGECLYNIETIQMMYAADQLTGCLYGGKFCL